MTVSSQLFADEMTMYGRASACTAGRRSRAGVHAYAYGARLARLTVLLLLAAGAALPSPAGATNFTTNQNAALQLGSASFTSANKGPNMARGFERPYGVQLDASGRVLVGDFGNNRLAVFNAVPTSNGAPLDIALRNLGRTDYRGGCSATMGRAISGAWSAAGRLAVVESVESAENGWNSRVLLYNSMPTTTGAAADLVLGQTDMTTCGSGAISGATFSRPAAVWTNGTRIIVSDRDRNRVLIWNSWPTTNGTAADLVLGQATMTSAAVDNGTESASTLDRPNGVWSDGTRIAVADTFNNRVLIWNSWPTTNAQPADIVVGQAGFTTTSSSCDALGMGSPRGVASDGTRLAITDSQSRVLLYDAFPTVSRPAANRVLGQATTSTCAGRNAGATTALTASSFAMPWGVSIEGGRLAVADRLNHRVLLWNAWPTADDQPADRVLGHVDFASAGPNDTGLHATFHSSYYGGVSPPSLDSPQEPNNAGAWPAIASDGELWISDSASSRLDRFGGWPTTHDQPPTMRFGQHADAQAFCNGTEDAISATSLCYPMGTWTDGTKLAIADTANHRVKIWHSMPTTRNQPPDVVLGQLAWTTRTPGTGEASLRSPAGVASDGTRLYVTDAGNNRVLGWMTWPVSNGQQADIVLGQPDFLSSTPNQGGRSAASLDEPIGISTDDGRLAVADQDNHRILIWNGLPTTQRQPADTVYGQSSFAAAATTNLSNPRGVALSDNAMVFTALCDAQWIDPIPTGIVTSGASRIGRGCASYVPSQPNVMVPTGIAAHRGSVWLANDGNARMTRFDDVTAPTITRGPAHAVRSGCNSLAVVSWTTSESGTSELHWGSSSAATPEAYEQHSVDLDITGLLHQRSLTGLAPGTYYYRVRTADAAGNAVVSPERSFVVGSGAPANDAFASPTSLTAGGGTLSSSTIGACDEAGEPQHAGVPGGSSVWHTWTAPTSGRWLFDTLGSSFDTTLAIYTGTAVGSLTPIASNDDASAVVRQSRLAFNAVAGTTYRIAVDGWYGDSGAHELNWRLVVNDAFASATGMSGTIDTESGSTVGATKETGEPNHAGNAGGASIWYSWTAPTTGNVTVDTLGSSFDTLLAAYTGSSVSALTLVASNDDAFGPGGPSRVTFAATMGTTYHFAVDGWNGATGDVTIQLVQPPTVTAATPGSGAQGRRSLVVQVSGTAFTASTTVSFSGSGIAVQSVSYVSPSRLDVTVDIASTATLGARDITVANPNEATGSGAFTVTAPAISVSFSTLGHGDTARDGASPWTLGLGPILPEAIRSVGPADSGQATAGPATRMVISSDTNAHVSVSATDWSSGSDTIAVSALAWKHHGVAEAWVPMSVTPAVTDTMLPAGTVTIEHDLQLTVPAAQRPGSYSTTVSYSVVATP